MDSGLWDHFHWIRGENLRISQVSMRKLCGWGGVGDTSRRAQGADRNCAQISGFGNFHIERGKMWFSERMKFSSIDLKCVSVNQLRLAQPDMLQIEEIEGQPPAAPLVGAISSMSSMSDNADACLLRTAQETLPPCFCFVLPDFRGRPYSSSRLKWSVLEQQLFL